MINLKNYVNRDEIVLTIPSTYPDKINKIIEKNSDNLKKYKTYRKKALHIENFKYKSKTSWIKQNKQKALNEKFSDTIIKYQELEETLFDTLNNYSIVFFHMTRLTHDEKSDILNNGMMIPTKALLINKIKKINIKDEYKLILIEHIKNLKDLKSNNNIYFQNDIAEINEEVEYYDNKIFLKDWGGESLYDYFENKKTAESTQVRDAVNSVSEPYMIIAAIPFSSLISVNMVYLDDIIEKVLLNYPNKAKRIIVSPAVYTTKFNILAVVPFNEKSKIKFQ